MIPIPGLSKLWSGLAIAGAAISLVLGILFLGRSWGKSSEKAKSLAARVKGQKVALDTAQDALDAQGMAQAKIETAKSAADVSVQAKKAELKKTGSISGGMWSIVLVAVLLSGCGQVRTVVLYPPIMDEPKVERPVLVPWTLVVGEPVDQETAEAIVTNEERLKGWGGAWEGWGESYGAFHDQYMKQAGEVRDE